MNGTQRLLAFAAIGLIDQAALENPAAGIDFWAKDYKGNGLFYLIASTYTGDSAGLAELLIAIYERMKRQRPDSDPLDQSNADGKKVETYLKENCWNAFAALLKQYDLDLERI